MKKKLLLVLLLVGLLVLTGCGKDSTKQDEEKSVVAKATVINNQGETESLSAKDLMNVNDENQARFNRDYKYAKITFTGTVKSVDVDANVFIESGKVSAHYNRIIFKEGFCLILNPEDTRYDLADYNKGDKLEITSGIIDARSLDTDFLKESVDERVVWLIGNDNVPTVITKK